MTKETTGYAKETVCDLPPPQSGATWGEGHFEKVNISAIRKMIKKAERKGVKLVISYVLERFSMNSKSILKIQPLLFSAYRQMVCCLNIETFIPLHM